MKTEDLKRDYKMYLNQIKRQIPEILKNGPLKRKTIIDKAVELSPLTPDDKKDFRASGILALYRSIVGTALQRMQQYGDICVNDHNEISLSKKPSVIVREAEVARYIIELLKTGTLTAKEILLALRKEASLHTLTENTVSAPIQWLSKSRHLFSRSSLLCSTQRAVSFSKITRHCFSTTITEAST